MPFLDAIPVNYFIIGTSLITGIILFVILTQIPDDEEETTPTVVSTPEVNNAKPLVKAKSTPRRKVKSSKK